MRFACFENSLKDLIVIIIIIESGRFHGYVKCLLLTSTSAKTCIKSFQPFQRRGKENDERILLCTALIKIMKCFSFSVALRSFEIIAQNVTIELCGEYSESR